MQSFFANIERSAKKMVISILLLFIVFFFIKKCFQKSILYQHLLQAVTVAKGCTNTDR